MIKCHECSHENNFIVPKLVAVKDEFEDINNDDLFDRPNVYCMQCGKYLMRVDTIYYNLNREYAILYRDLFGDGPNNGVLIFPQIELNTNNEKIKKIKEKRYVYNKEDLLEKIKIFSFCISDEVI